MSTFAILATGPSMNQLVADDVRGRCACIAVSDAYRLAPWADALVSQDEAWWKHHKEARNFAGRRFGGPAVRMDGIERLEPGGPIATGTNSGLLAAIVAVQVFQAKRVILLGFDMGGSHFFGNHPAPLRNTTPPRFKVMLEQFQMWRPRGVEVINCTPNSRLLTYPKADLCDVLGSTFA